MYHAHHSCSPESAEKKEVLYQKGERETAAEEEASPSVSSAEEEARENHLSPRRSLTFEYKSFVLSIF